MVGEELDVGAGVDEQILAIFRLFGEERLDIGQGQLGDGGKGRRRQESEEEQEQKC
jgi:hypothetical protein